MKNLSFKFRNVATIVACLVMCMMLACCGERDSSWHKIKMTVTVAADEEVRFYLKGNGIARIDWGDSSRIETCELDYDEYSYCMPSHAYEGAALHTVIVYANNIEIFSFYSSNLTSLDVSRCTELIELNCGVNQLTSLDVSKNIALEKLDCKSNMLSSSELNSLFGTLHSNSISNKTKEICIMDNPGNDDCNKDIFNSKGWVELEW